MKTETYTISQEDLLAIVERHINQHDRELHPEIAVRSIKTITRDKQSIVFNIETRKPTPFPNASQ